MDKLRGNFAVYKWGQHLKVCMRAAPETRPCCRLRFVFYEVVILGHLKLWLSATFSNLAPHVLVKGWNYSSVRINMSLTQRVITRFTNLNSTALL